MEFNAASEFADLGLKREIAGRLSETEVLSRNGMRTFGTVTIFGHRQIIEYAKENPEMVSAGWLAFGTLMDGRLVVINLGDFEVGYMDQFDPDYPNGLSELYVSLGLSMDDYAKLLSTGSDKLPSDYEEALKRAGREFRWS